MYQKISMARKASKGTPPTNREVAVPKTKAATKAITPIHAPAAHRFPLDLVIYILPYLSDDPGAILDCTLTSKAWYTLARRYIYHTISIASPEDYDRLVRLLDEKEEIRPWVQKLRVSSHFDPVSQTWPNYIAWINGDASHSILGKIPKLCTLVFFNLYKETMLAFRVFSTVEELVLMKCKVSETELADVIQQFPRLSTLEVLSCEISRRSEGSEFPPTTTPLSLNHLTIHAEPEYHGVPNWYLRHPRLWNTNDFWKWLRESGHVNALRSLVVQFADSASPSPAEIGCLVKLVENSLEELTLKLMDAQLWSRVEGGRSRFSSCLIIYAIIV